MAGGKTHFWGGFVFVIIFIYTITNYFYQPSLIEVVIYFALACMFSVSPLSGVTTKLYLMFL